MSDDRRTRADLIEALESAHAQVRDLTRRIPTTAEVSKTGTAALAACVSALDGVDTRDRLSSVYSARNTEVEWVVRALCDRYAVKTGTPACDRPHVDDLSPQTVSLIQSGVIR